MHVATETALVVVALLAAMVVAAQRGDRLFPVIAVVVAAIEALIVFKILRISVTRLRIDLVLPGLLTVAGAVSWSRVSAKSAVAAATAVVMVGLIQLLSALDFLR